MKARFKKTLRQKHFKVLVFLLVWVFTFILRSHNYDRVPEMGHLEEMLYAWSGIYLVETGTPVSWSTLDYPKRAEVYKGEINYKGGPPYVHVNLWKPWLDEPPLFSLLVGFSEHLFGADRHFVIPSSYDRAPIILFSLLTSLFVFLVAKKLSSYWMGILAMGLYGTIPIMVFASRMAVPENIITLLYLIEVYLLAFYKENGKFRYLFLIPFLAGIAGLSKPTGYFIVFLAAYIVFIRDWTKEKKFTKVFLNCCYLLLMTIPFVLAFLVYGWHFDKEIFSRIVSIQGFRPVGFSSLGFYFTTPAFDINTLTDCWYIFCLLAAAYFIFTLRESPRYLVCLAFVFYLLVVMLSGGQEDLLPWYRFPTLPFLAIFGAWGLEILVKRADFLVSFLGAGLLLGSRTLLVNAFRSDISPTAYRVIMPSLLAPSLAGSIFNLKWLEKLSRIVLVIVIAVGIYFNVVYIYNRYELSCENQSCPLGPQTGLSTLYFPVIWKFFVLR